MMNVNLPFFLLKEVIQSGASFGHSDGNFIRSWQARAYAKALNATLFFSSATYNINVNKIFKFITAKLFDIPWALERNLTIGEPIIDF